MAPSWFVFHALFSFVSYVGFFFFLREIVIPLHGIAFLAVHRMMKRKNIDSV